MIPKTPRGFRDVLPTEAAWRRSTSDVVCRQFELWGYQPIETPAVELAAVLDEARSLDNTAAQFTTSAEAPFRFFDSDSNLVVLRPDVTIPVARLAATRLREKPGRSASTIASPSSPSARPRMARSGSSRSWASSSSDVRVISPMPRS